MSLRKSVKLQMKQCWFTDHISECDGQLSISLVMFHSACVIKNITTALILHILVILQQTTSLVLTETNKWKAFNIYAINMI